MNISRNRHGSVDILVVAVIWILASWVTWNLVHWIDPGYRSEAARHSPSPSPRGLTPQSGR